VVKAKPGSNGGRQEMAAERYDDATSTWYTTWAAWDFTKKEYSSIRFSTNATSDPRKYSGAAQEANAVFCPPSMTGRGVEIHAFHPAWGEIRVWDFADMNFKTFPGYDSNCGGQHRPCSDGERSLYFWDSLQSRLVRWDVRDRAIATWVLKIDGRPVTGDRAAAHMNSQGGGDHAWFEWNEVLHAIEFYVARTELWLDLFLIDVSGTPTIRHIASADQNGLPLRGNNPIKVPPYKGKPQRTILTGGISFDLVRTPPPDKYRTLVVSRDRRPAGTR